MSKNGLRVLSVLMCVFVVLTLLIGCGSSPKNNTQTSTNVAKEGTPIEKTKLVVRTLHPDGDPFKKNLQDCIDEYNKTNKFNAQLELETITGDSAYQTKLTTDMASGNAPDIFYWWVAGTMKPFAENDRVVAFNEYLDADKTWKDSFISGVLDKASINGKVYSIPSGLAIAYVYYNTETFSKYSLTPPKTYSELLTTVKTLRENGVTPFSVGGKDAWLPGLTTAYLCLRQGGAEMYNKILDSRKGFNNEDYLKAFKMFQELKSIDAFEEGCLTSDYTASENLFMNGKAAMRVMINNEVGVFDGESSAVKGKFGVFPFPTTEGGKGDIADFMGMPDQNLAIASSTKNKEAAVDFVKLFTGPVYQKKNVETGGLLPTTKVEYDISKISTVNVDTIKLLSQAKNVVLFPDVQVGAEIGDILYSAAQMVIAGKDSAEALNGVEDKVSKVK